MDKLSAIILAAGRGTRMQSTDTNKVAMQVKGEPMVVRTIKILKEAGISQFVVVVGFAKESVIPLLPKEAAVAEQDQQLGTGHAVLIALTKVSELSPCVLIVNGDDAFMHSPETFVNLYNTFKDTGAQLAFITAEMDNPVGLGRIIRSDSGDVIGIVEEKNATDLERGIKEVNIGCYLINKNHLQSLLQKVEKNPISGEYYLTDIIDLIVREKGKVVAYKLSNNLWRGVNTREDLIEAEKMVKE